LNALLLHRFNFLLPLNTSSLSGKGGRKSKKSVESDIDAISPGEVSVK
jgi:hypothetical protein